MWEIERVSVGDRESEWEGGRERVSGREREWERESE